MTAISWLLTTEGTQATAGMKTTTGPPTQYGWQQKQESEMTAVAGTIASL